MAGLWKSAVKITLIFRHDGPFEVHFQQKYRKSTAKTLAQKAFHAHFRD